MYDNSKKGWMTSRIVLEWLGLLDNRMREQERHILLLVDNVSSHCRPAGTPLTNVRLEFLPKNTTSILQPLDQGIITNLKQHITSIRSNHAFEMFLADLEQEKADVVTGDPLGKMGMGCGDPEDHCELLGTRWYTLGSQ